MWYIHNCAFPTVVFVYVSVPVHVCGCAGQGICRYVGGCFLLNLPLVCIDTFNVSLDLQGHCSDQFTLICRHSDNVNDPHWIHNDTTVEGGDVLGTAFPGAVYTVEALTEHTVTITGVDTVRALDGHVIQCVYNVLGNLVKSNAVKFSFIPPGQSWNPLAVLGVPWLGYVPYSAIVVFTLCGSLQLTIVVTLTTCTLC